MGKNVQMKRMKKGKYLKENSPKEKFPKNSYLIQRL